MPRNFNYGAQSASCSLQVLAYTGNDDAKKFVLDEEVTLDNVKVETLSLSLGIPFHISFYSLEKYWGGCLIKLRLCTIAELNVKFLRLLRRISWKTS